MRKFSQFFIPTALIAAVALFVGGCAIELGNGAKTESREPTLGKQLIDLQKARDAGAITPAEFEAKKAELLKK